MFNVSVSSAVNGAIKLGATISVDGHIPGMNHRVQTHLHADHMENLRDSYSGHIYMSDSSRAYLNERWAHFEMLYRVKDFKLPGIFEVEDNQVTILDSRHMLGAVQVSVRDGSDRTFGYSGDFSWPLDETIKVQELVVDGTCGSPNSQPTYSQMDVDEHFVNLIEKELTSGPVLIRAVHGTMERALQCLLGVNTGKIIVPDSLLKYRPVYARFGTVFPPDLVSATSEEGRQIAQTKRYLKLIPGNPNIHLEQPFEGKTVVCTGFNPHPEQPVQSHGINEFRVSITNHADLSGTLKFIESTGAEKVVVDASRLNTIRHATEIAEIIQDSLHIQAVSSDKLNGNIA